MANRNTRSFTDVCRGYFGRKVIYSNAIEITENNIVKELGKALSIHWQNREEIEYLDNYYKGSQPILYRNKLIRPEVNNKVVENHAYEIVEFMTAQNFAEPVQYVRRGTEEKLSEAINQLNEYMIAEDKGNCDIVLGRWRSICGTAYRFVWQDKTKKEFDEAPFGFEALDPRDAFVVYSAGDGHEPLFSCQARKDENDKQYYRIYTDKMYWEIQNSKIINRAYNGFNMIPVIEYPNNDRRLSDIEIVITMLDQINKMQSDRMNGIEQFVQSFMKFVNCDINEEEFKNMKELGAIVLKGQQGTNADVDMLTSELNQEQTQTSKDDIYNNILTIEGMPSREQNTGGDTGQAVYLRNGWDFAEQRANLKEPIFHKSEKQFLRIIFKILNTKRQISLRLSNIEIKVTRSKTDNMSVKANVLTLLLNAGIDYQVAIKTASLWSDPEDVYLRSKKRLEDMYENKPEQTIPNGTETGQNSTGPTGTKQIPQDENKSSYAKNSDNQVERTTQK